MHRCFGFLATAVIATTFLMPIAPATALTYTEPPDLSNDINTPTALGILDLGTNTFDGSFLSLSDLHDAFSVMIPSGLDLIQINYYTNINGDFLTSQLSSVGLQSSTIPGFLSEGPVGGGGFFNPPIPPPGQHIFEVFATCDTTCTGEIEFGGGSINLTWRVELITAESSAVPLPAAFPLFASGLGVMGLLGWRRKRKRAAAMAAA